jgi:TRAP-type C4-dicarboxylate transport system permease small subunit
MRRAVKTRIKFEEVLGVACMAGLVLITLGNVLTRYFSDQSFAWTEEISVFLLVVMTFAGAASIAGRDGHIRIEFFYDRGSAARRRGLRLFSAVATCALFLALALLFGVVLVDEVRWAETSMGLGVPRWWFTAVVPLLCLAIAARAAHQGLRIARLPPDADPGKAATVEAEVVPGDGPADR